MQQIFFNAKFWTFDENKTIAEAILVNDGNIVFAGSKDDIFSMKSKDTKLIDLKGNNVLPAFFDSNLSLYKIIEDRLKNANKNKFLENNDELDENYDKFINYKHYKKEFLNLQDECLKLGITTVFEFSLSAKEFIFWKKLSEEKLLKIDVVGYVDIINFKSIMDDNCRSYRKYKNHFRLGGYYLEIDGELLQKKAWLNKPYKHEGKYIGSSNVGFEQLSFLIKAALDEKKQLVVSASGDRAVEEFIEAFSEQVKDRDLEYLIRPIIANCNLVSKTQLEKLKALSVSTLFKISDIESGKQFIRNIGRRIKLFQPVAWAEKVGVKFLLCSNKLNINNSFILAKYAVNRNFLDGKILGKKQRICTEIAFKSLFTYSAYLAFDDAHKGSLENGKLANFIVLDKFDLNNFYNSTILSTYIEGVEVYKLK